MKKAAKKVAKKAVAPKAPVKKTAAKKTAPKKVPAKKGAKKVAKKAVTKAAVKKVAKQLMSHTVVVANIDVGFGNALYLRADAPGLSWSKGVPMDCVGDTSWSIAISGVAKPFEYKVLINDLHWSSGGNCIAKPGVKNACSPSF